ncbi:MAG: hypothetical protein QM817_16265 [Archangium sp.]
MRLALTVIAVSLLGACSRKSEAPDASVSTGAHGTVDWQTFSFNGVAILTGYRDGSKCVVTCEGRGGKLMWQREDCIASRNDLRFVSHECEVVLVLRDTPQVKDSVAASPVGAVWFATNVETPVRLHQVADAEKGVKLSDSGKWFGWLAGTLENEGQKPRYSASGQSVEFETLDGVHHELTFDELARWVDRLPEPKPEVVAPREPAAAAQSFFRWTDDEGIEHMGTEDQIPAKFRKRAKLIQTELAVVRAEGVDAGVRDAGLDEPDAGPPPPINKCDEARFKLSIVEKELASLEAPPPCELEANRIKNGTQMFGAEERLQCRQTYDARLRDYEQKKAALEQARANAQEALRRAQVGGC